MTAGEFFWWGVLFAFALLGFLATIVFFAAIVCLILFIIAWPIVAIHEAIKTRGLEKEGDTDLLVSS